MKRVFLNIFGQVQGVFFRYQTQKTAKKFNLIGWVRNEPDGAVQIVAEGEEEDLKKLIDWCQKGPKFAKIEKIEVKWEEATGEFKGFMIKYE